VRIIPLNLTEEQERGRQEKAQEGGGRVRKYMLTVGSFDGFGYWLLGYLPTCFIKSLHYEQ
jgi:hypothetical protein